MAPFEYFDHTADMGMRAEGRDLAQLFTDSAVGMFNLTVPLDAFQLKEEREISLRAENAEELLWNWLRERRSSPTVRNTGIDIHC